MGLGTVGKTVIGGVGIGGLYGYYSLSQRRKALSVPASGQDYFLKSPPSGIPITKAAQFAEDKSGLKLTLFQYQTCPFCCKVRSFLNYYGISHEIVEVNPVLRKEVKWSAYKKVPILLSSLGETSQQLNDSTMIVSALYSYLHDPSQGIQTVAQYYPSLEFVDDKGNKKPDILNKYAIMYGSKETVRTKEDIKSERAWRLWSDKVLVHTLSPNVYRSPSEALKTFTWFSHMGNWEEVFPPWERYLVIYVGAAAMFFIGKLLKRRHDLKDDVRQSLYDACNIWLKELNKRKTPFHGGQKPNLADLAVYGTLNSIEGCGAFNDLLEHTKISEWYCRMQQEVELHNGAAYVR